VAARHRLAPDAAAGLGTLGGLALGTAAGISLHGLASAGIHRHGSPGELINFGMVVIAAVLEPIVAPGWRRRLILGATAVLLIGLYTHLGDHGTLLAEALLLALAAVAVRGSAALIAGSAVAAFGLVAFICWLSLGDAFTVVNDIPQFAVQAVAATVLLVAPLAGVQAALRGQGAWLSGLPILAIGVGWIAIQLRSVAELADFLGLVGTGALVLIIVRRMLRPPSRAVS
jgi:hypothetical protein